MRLTVIAAPPIEILWPTQVAARKFDAVDEFASALSLAAGIVVPVVEGSLADAPDQGFLIVFNGQGHALESLPELGPRTILINADRASIRQEMEIYHLAAAVEEHRYYRWCRQQDQENNRGLLGRKDVAERMGATLLKSPFTTEHYGEFSHPRCQDLPGLLVTYLAALEQG